MTRDQLLLTVLLKNELSFSLFVQLIFYKSIPSISRWICKVEFFVMLPIFIVLCPFYLFILNLFIYLFLAALGLHCCVQAFSSCDGAGATLCCGARVSLVAMASLVAEHGFQARGQSSCGAWAQ